MEGTGELLVFTAGDFKGFGAIGIRRYELAAPDHYFYFEVGFKLYIGHLRHGFVQVIDRATGAEMGRIEGRRILHGKAYVSLPHEGRIAVVGLESAEVERYIETGGEPTRIVLVQVDGEVTSRSTHRMEADHHGHHHNAQ
jgi:hypothetical protein